MSGGVDSELDLDFVSSSEHGLSHSSRPLDPAERPFDHVSALHARFVGGPGLRPAVDRRPFGFGADMSSKTEIANA